jgi:PRTRC genetic system ThiF family protein
MANKKRTPKPAASFDLSYVNAVPVLLRDAEELRLYLVGCGGTGSWLAPDIARLAAEFRARWRNIRITFVDPDTVEPVNIPRQNFCQAEVGASKAETLAARYGSAWGLEIAAVTKRFQPSLVDAPWRAAAIIIGCVDNAAARKSIAGILDRNSPTPSVWWLDCGNAVQSGQVLLGSAPTVRELAGAFAVPTFCSALPSPALQHPELLMPLPEESKGARMSCAEIAAANRQALTVNKQVAAHAAAMLSQFLAGELRYFALYFDQASGTARSRYVTPENVKAAVRKPNGT